MFESPYIKVNEQGIDLIKNYQVDKHIEYCDIKTILLKKGHLINNWILSLVLSLLLTGAAIIWGLKSTITFDIHSIPSSHFRLYIAVRLIIPWLLVIGGSIWMYLSTKHSPIILINTQQKRYKIALKEFEKKDMLKDLIDFLSERVKVIKQYYG